MSIRIKFIVLYVMMISFYVFASENMDLVLLKSINGTDEPWFDVMKPVISTDYFAGIVGISPFFLNKEQTILSFGLTLGEVELFKLLFHRPRPFQTYDWVVKRADASGYSMPSGHAAMAFEAAYIWSEYFPQFSIAFYSLATYIAISRVYYGVHYPSDVIFGAILGYLNSKIVFQNTRSKTLSFGFSYSF